MSAKTNIKKLPLYCYSVLLIDNSLIKVVAGERGYTRIGQSYPKRICELNGISMDELADIWNAEMGITKGEREAMDIGSMWGWEVPGADPEGYTPEGVPIKI